MTDPARLRRRRTTIYVATTLAASATGAAAVGWAATTPVAQTAPSLRQASPRPADGQAVAHRLRAARTALERVRRDVTTLVRQVSTLPSPHLTGAGPVAASGSGSGSVYVPPAAPVMQAAPAAAPPAHTTTGASGVKP